MSNDGKICFEVSGRSGFTLVELLVVTAIMAMVAALILANVARAKIAAHRIT